MTATQTSSREKPKRKCVARQKVKQVRSPASGSTSAITVDPASERITKHDKALTLLSRRDGATIHDMMDATGWQQHSVRGFLAGTVKKSSALSSRRPSQKVSCVAIASRPSVAAEMSAPDLLSELAQLDGLTNFELRTEWRRLHRRQPPPSFSQDLLLLGLAYKIQEKALGGLSQSARRKLSQRSRLAEESSERNARQRIELKPGTRLVREWNGTSHTVLVHADGEEWRGKRHRSLSKAACEITRGHWSGPRSFGLKVERSDG
jgi:hypothetical protein